MQLFIWRKHCSWDSLVQHFGKYVYLSPCSELEKKSVNIAQNLASIASHWVTGYICLSFPVVSTMLWEQTCVDSGSIYSHICPHMFAYYEHTRMTADSADTVDFTVGQAVLQVFKLGGRTFANIRRSKGKINTANARAEQMPSRAELLQLHRPTRPQESWLLFELPSLNSKVWRPGLNVLCVEKKPLV